MSRDRSAGARWDRRLVWLGVPLALLLVRSALLPGWTLLGFDLFLFDLPRLELLARAWGADGLAGWCVSMGLGQPLVADLAMAVHYPAHALLLVARPTVALSWLTALHVAAAYAGAYLLARRLDASPLAAALAGLAYAGGGVMTTYVHSPALLIGSTWMPWAVLLSLRAVAPGAPWRRTLLAALPFSLAFLGASPELAACAGALSFALAVGTGAGVARAIVRMAAVALFAAALAASTLWPFLQVAGDTNRAVGLGYDAAARWSLHPFELLGVLAPMPFGRGGFAPTVLGHEERCWYVAGLHLGAASAAAGLAAIARVRRDARARLLACAALPFLVYAFGRWGPLYPALYEVLPPIRSLRYPAKAFVPVSLCLAVLAAIGLDWLRRAPRRRELLLVGGANVLVALAAFGRGEGELLVERACVTALAATAALAALVGRRSRLVVVITLIELALLGRWAFDIVPAPTYEAPPALAAPLVTTERGQRPLRVATTRRASEVRGVAVPGLPRALVDQRSWREALMPNTGMGIGVRTTFGFSSFTPARVVALREAALDLPLTAFYERFGASHLVHASDEALDERDAARVAAVGPWVLSRLERAPPWAAVYARPHRAADLDEAVARVADPSFDPRHACVVEGLEDPPADPGPPARAGRAWPVRLEDDRLVLEVDATTSGVLVVREGWGSGWSARVDGRPAPVLPADVVFRAVPVPPGRHEVVLEYEAPGRRAGAIVASLALVALALAAAREVVAARQA